MFKKPELTLQTTTLWEYPSQHYGHEIQGDKDYIGATPSWVIWNLLQRYTKKNDLVVDPMCGSGTTIDVCKDLGRRFLGYDLVPSRPDIFRADARKLPLEDGKADFVFVDPPYSTHVNYSDDPACIGKLSALESAYYESMAQVISEIHRVLRDRRYMGLYVSDSFKKGKPFMPIGFRLFSILERYFAPVDIICVVRHNRTLKRRHWHTEAIEGNYYLRGFNYLFIMKKDSETHPVPSGVPAVPRARLEPSRDDDDRPRPSRTGRAGRPGDGRRPRPGAPRKKRPHK